MVFKLQMSCSAPAPLTVLGVVIVGQIERGLFLCNVNSNNAVLWFISINNLSVRVSSSDGLGNKHYSINIIWLIFCLKALQEIKENSHLVR